MLLLWLIPLAFLVALVMYLAGPSRTWKSAAEKAAIDILNQRYARGEIGKEEFEQKNRDIGS